MRWIYSMILIVIGAAQAWGWTEPERGSDTRAALMDAMRPHAEWVFGAPVQFVVRDLRVSGEYGFAMLSAQRPGGAAIHVPSTPGFARGTIDTVISDPTQIEVLYRLSGQTWVAVHFGMGSTDVWFSWTPYCDEYDAVIADYCK